MLERVEHMQPGQTGRRDRVGAVPMVVGVLGLVLVAGLPVRGADDASDAEQPGFFHLTELEGSFQLQSEFDWRRVETPRDNLFRPWRGRRQTDREWRLEETVGLRFAGDVVYPELLTYDVLLRLGLDQVRATEQDFYATQRDHDQGWLTEYDVRIDVLSQRPINFNLFATREDQRIDRRFLSSLRRDMWRTGATVRWDNDRFPMELTFEHLRDRYTGNSDLFDDEDFEDTLVRYSGTLNITEHHQLQVDAEHGRLNQKYSGSDVEFNTTRTVLNLDDRLQFGSEHQHLFEILFEYEEDRGDLPRDHLTVVPQLTLKHSDALSTRYRYQYSRDRFEYVLLRSHRLDFGLTHRLGDKLTTTGDVFFERETSNDGMTRYGYGTAVRSTYRRKNRWGVFSATAGHTYDNTRIWHDQRSATAIDETIFFQDPLPVFLAHPHVVTNSIVVTDAARTRVFVAGRDYVVSVRGIYTALFRVRTGRIADRQSVLVRYRYRTADKMTAHTHQIDLRVQQDFDSGWTPYYAGNVQFQDLSFSGTVRVEADKQNRHRLGATYRANRWSAGGEIEFNDETIDPYNALHGHADWSILTGYPNQLDLRVGASQYWFRQFDRRRTSIVDISLDYRRPLFAGADFNARGAYRYEHDSALGETHGIDVKTGVECRIGELTINCDVEYDKLSVADANDDGLSVWFRLRRDFPDLLGQR